MAPLAPIVSQLLTNGLGLLANAVMAKGKDYVEKKFDVKLSPEMTSEDLTRLQMAQMEHEEELLRIKLEDNKLDLARYELSLKDTGNARKREIEIASAEIFRVVAIHNFSPHSASRFPKATISGFANSAWR